MKADEFTKQVIERANLASREEALSAIKATLETLSEHLTPDEATNFSSQLPPEIAVYLHMPYSEGRAESFSLPNFFERVSKFEDVPLQTATYHARVVAALLSESVTIGQIEHLRAQLPPDIARLFDVQNEGELPTLE